MLHLLFSILMFVVLLSLAGFLKEKNMNVLSVIVLVFAAIFGLSAAFKLFGLLLGVLGFAVALVLALIVPIAIIGLFVLVVKYLYKKI